MNAATKRSRAVLEALRTSQGATAAELATLTGEPESYIRRLLKYERKKGIVDSEQIGTGWVNFLVGRPRKHVDVRARVEAAIRIEPGITIDRLVLETRLARSTIGQVLAEGSASGRLVWSPRKHGARCWRLAAACNTSPTRAEAHTQEPSHAEAV